MKDNRTPAVRGAIRVASALEGLDLDKLTGQSELLRGVGDFRAQVASFTEMLERRSKVTELVTGMSAIDSMRRDVLGRAFVASDIASSLGLDRAQFLDRSTTSINAIAGAQLSTVAKQAMLGRTLEPPTISGVVEPQAFATLTRLSQDFHKALLASRPRGLGASVFAESLRRLTRPFASGAWSFLE
ncbi:MAG: hypothetical protein ACRDNG_08130, partial [Gaiellaceae bacterium]